MSAIFANRTTRWSLGAVAACLVLIIAAWFLLISPRRADASDLRSQAEQSDQQAQLLQVKLTELKSQAQDLPKQKQKLAAIAAQLTPDADLPAYLRLLQSTSAEAGVTLSSISPGTPVVVTGTSAAGAAGTTAASTDGTGQAGDLVSLPMNLELTGDYYQLSLWLKALQTKLSRSYLISAFTLTPGGDTSSGVNIDGTGLSGAALSDSTGTTANTTATLSSSSGSSSNSDTKGGEGVTTPTTSSSAGATSGTTSGTGGTTDGTGATVTIAPTTVPSTVGAASDQWSLSLTGNVFVLLSDDSTLAEVQADAAAAKLSLGGTFTTVTPSATNTPIAPGAGSATTGAVTPSAGATTAPSMSNPTSASTSASTSGQTAAAN